MRLFSDAERMPSERASIADRRTRAAAKLRERGFGALLVSPSADLFYLSGYQMFPSERLTCLVLDADGTATMVCPALEAPRATVAAPDVVLTKTRTMLTIKLPLPGASQDEKLEDLNNFTQEQRGAVLGRSQSWVSQRLKDETQD